MDIWITEDLNTCSPKKVEFLLLPLNGSKIQKCQLPGIDMDFPPPWFNQNILHDIMVCYLKCM